MNNTMKNKMKTSVITFDQALNILEEKYDATYNGTATVREMTTDLQSAIGLGG